MTRKERDEIKAMVDKLRAEASFVTALPSTTVFDLTNPIMRYIELAALPTGRRSRVANSRN